MRSASDLRRLLRSQRKAGYLGLKRLMPRWRWLDRWLLLPAFVQGHGRLPRRTCSPDSWPSDYVYARATSDGWSDLERRATDKAQARVIAAELAPQLKFAACHAVLDVPEHACEADLRAMLQPYLGLHVVAKPTHSCGGVLYLREEPTDEEWRQFHLRCVTDYYLLSRERQYRGLAKRIIVEEVIGRGESLIDMKFRGTCGRVPSMNIGFYEGIHRRLGFYACPDWRALHFDLPSGARLASGSRHVDIDLARPEHLDEMLDIAEKLSRPFSFVRVDLYATPDGVYFGEFTLTPTGGRRPLLPSVASNLQLGRMIRESRCGSVR